MTDFDAIVVGSGINMLVLHPRSSHKVFDCGTILKQSGKLDIINLNLFLPDCTNTSQRKYAYNLDVSHEVLKQFSWLES